jgi:hypothetical protein
MGYPFLPDTEKFYHGKEKVKNQHRLLSETEIHIAVNKPAIVENGVQHHTNLGPGKGKGNFTLEEATKAQRGSRGIALLFL